MLACNRNPQIRLTLSIIRARVARQCGRGGSRLRAPPSNVRLLLVHVLDIVVLFVEIIIIVIIVVVVIARVSISSVQRMVRLVVRVAVCVHGGVTLRQRGGGTAVGVGRGGNRGEVAHQDATIGV
jgi:hypothetical protein